MGYRFYPALITAAIVLIGHVLKWTSLLEYKKRRDETIEFSNRFIELANYYIEHCSIEPELYAVCIHDVDKIQKGRNYQLFMNILPEMRSMVNQLDSIMIRERIGQLPGLCDDALRRHVGNLDRVIEQEKKSILNPFLCFGSGILLH